MRGMEGRGVCGWSDRADGERREERRGKRGGAGGEWRSGWERPVWRRPG